MQSKSVKIEGISKFKREIAVRLIYGKGNICCQAIEQAFCFSSEQNNIEGLQIGACLLNLQHLLTEM